MDITWEKTEQLVDELATQLTESGWIPSFIIGITRGGLIPATILSHKLLIPMCSLDISIHNPNQTLGTFTSSFYPEEIYNGHKFLIIDDINKSGETLSWIKSDWRQTILQRPKITRSWPWTHIKFGVIVNNVHSTFKCDYSAMDIDLELTNVKFPWENKKTV